MKFGDCESITLPLRVENASAENGKSGAEPVAHGSGQPLSHKSQHAPFWVRSVLWDNKNLPDFRAPILSFIHDDM